MDENKEQMAYAMTCFCDIPLARISEHTEFYGSFGIGLNKEWGMKNGLDPILYCHKGGKTTEAIRTLIDEARKAQIPSESPVRQNLNRLLTMTKPLSGTMIVGDQKKQKEFHQENEWRYVPNPNFAILQRAFSERREQRNEEYKKYALKFLPADVKYIFIGGEHEIPSLVDFIHSELENISQKDMKILTSKIMTLSSIKNDL